MSSPERRNGGDRRRVDRRDIPDSAPGGLTGDGLLGSIIESSDEAILSKDLEGTVTSWNPAAERLYGYSAAEAIGRKVVDLIAPPDHVSEIPEILRRVALGEKISHYVTERRSKHGRIIDILLSVSPIYGADGQVVGASAIAHELSDSERQTASVEILSKRVHDLKNNISTLGTQLGAFMTREQATEEIEKRQVALEKRLRWRTIAGLVVAALVGAILGIAGSQYTSHIVREESRRADVKACHERADSNQAIRDIIDRSTSQQSLDPSKLSPTAREILGEFQRAQQATPGQESIRDFVYAKTPIPDCNKI